MLPAIEDYVSALCVAKIPWRDHSLAFARTIVQANYPAISDCLTDFCGIEFVSGGMRKCARIERKKKCNSFEGQIPLTVVHNIASKLADAMDHHVACTSYDA